MDLVVRAGHIPAAGETILGSGFAMHPGGKGANQAVGVARLGWPVEMIGMLGGGATDAMGATLRAHLMSAGVGVDGVGMASNRDVASGIALITVAESGENSIVVAQGANAHLKPEWIERQAARLKSAAMVLVQLEIPLETVIRVAEICAEAEVPLMLDPAPARELPEPLFPRVTWMTPNETEAAFYAGTAMRDPGAVAAMLQGRGVAAVVVKMGVRGAWLADAEGYAAHVEPFAVEAVDSTAAGDAFNAALAVALVEGRSTVEAARFAAAAAAISVTRAGAQASMATREEVLALLARRSSEAG